MLPRKLVDRIADTLGDAIARHLQRHSVSGPTEMEIKVTVSAVEAQRILDDMVEKSERLIELQQKLRRLA